MYLWMTLEYGILVFFYRVFYREVKWDAFNKKYNIDELRENIWINPNE